MDNYNYNLLGETPAKKNSRINLKNGVSIPSKKYQDWHKSAINQLKTQIIPETPIRFPVEISLNFTHGDMRRRDSDNGCSSIMDLLVDAQILNDDCWMIVQKINIINTFSKGSPSCSISIIPIL